MGGSLRMPAQWNRIMSLKATPGRIPSSESGLGLAAMTAFGPLARSVEDLRLGYATLARHDPRDPWGVSGLDQPAERDQVAFAGSWSRSGRRRGRSARGDTPGRVLTRRRATNSPTASRHASTTSRTCGRGCS